MASQHHREQQLIHGALHTEKEIPEVIHLLTQTPPDIQRQAIEKYFTRDASFTHPFCRTGKFANSRALILYIYRWYKIMSPRIDMRVNSVGKMDSSFFLPLCPPAIATAGVRWLLLLLVVVVDWDVPILSHGLLPLARYRPTKTFRLTSHLRGWNHQPSTKTTFCCTCTSPRSSVSGSFRSTRRR